VEGFYEQVIQMLRPWAPAPPRMRTPEDVAPVEPVTPTLISTAPSSQDTADDAASDHPETDSQENLFLSDPDYPAPEPGASQRESGNTEVDVFEEVQQ
jgi:hypothetical protein